MVIEPHRNTYTMRSAYTRRSDYKKKPTVSLPEINLLENLGVPDKTCIRNI